MSSSCSLLGLVIISYVLLGLFIDAFSTAFIKTALNGRMWQWVWFISRKKPVSFKSEGSKAGKVSVRISSRIQNRCVHLSATLSSICVGDNAQG
jgi:hypothetical protein